MAKRQSEPKTRADESSKDILPKTDGRNIARELNDGRAGQFGLAVDARCIGCKRVRAKRVSDRDNVEDGPASFKAVCHTCRGVTYWNIIRELNVPEGAE